MGEKRLCLSDLAQVTHRYVCLYIYIPISIFSMKVFACGVWNPGLRIPEFSSRNGKVPLIRNPESVQGIRNR